ncbi:interleukin-6 [Accipiter gentilis]|uniref:interleukin-6 n=1 Tax=Astur gentilis TaxID=8957 RepID=UPI00211007EB|nr:interleukin-6 [Accipiter gentilis]
MSVRKVSESFGAAGAGAGPGPAGTGEPLAAAAGQHGPQGPPLLLLLLLPRAAAAPLAADSSGEAEPEEAAGRRAALPDCVRLARLLHARAAQLQEEMCEKFTVCKNSMEMLAQNNLNLPKVTEEDGCLLAGFDEDKCLRKISSGLFTFQTYLQYIQETFTSEKQNVESLCYSTEHLANTIRQMVVNPDEVIIPDSATQESLRAKLKSNKNWIEKITTHLILRDFTSFMEKTVRAIRYLKNTRSFSV